MGSINSFSGEYEFLSNFYKVDIEYKGFLFPSTENAYQAMKSSNPDDWEQFVRLSPGQSKRLGRSLTLRNDWERIKVEIMNELLHIKFSNPELRDKLLSTGDSILIEGNHWHDVFWGMTNGQGLNILGQLLMNIRREIRDERFYFRGL